MIDWIKFKGNTEQERKEEAIFPCGMAGKFCGSIFKQKEDTSGYDLLAYSHWGSLNFPKEEKWERKNDFGGEMYNLGKSLNQEFDNIYEKLNELKDKL